jgi:hypothetical protein
MPCHDDMDSLKSRRINYQGNHLQIKRLVIHCAATVFLHYFQDNSKAPLNNEEAKPAPFTPSSLDVYFGINQGPGKTKDSVMRLACGVCSGTSSIGLNPSTYSIHSASPEIIDLLNTATNAVQNDKQWSEQMNKQ